MSDNPQYGGEPLRLSQYRILDLSGRDAVAFAQSQFMNDVAALADGQWQWSGWLDPKGRVQALFALLRRDAESVWLVTTTDGAALADALQRFVFRSKLRISVVEAAVTGTLSSPERARGGTAYESDDGAVELDFTGDAGARSLLIRANATSPEAPGADTTDWWALDLAHGWPALPGVALDAWTPQQLSLQRFDAFSVRKGCYPGQEIVARTHFLGRAKRGLARLGVAAPAGATLTDADARAVGQVVCSAGPVSLAVVPVEPDDLELRLDGAPCPRLPLAGGLAR